MGRGQYKWGGGQYKWGGGQYTWGGGTSYNNTFKRETIRKERKVNGLCR